MELRNIVLAFILSRLYQSVFGQRHQMKRRSSNGEPILHLKVSHSLSDNAAMTHGSAYDYGFVVSHDPASRAHALGVHVTWMLTPFVKFHKVTSFQHIGSYRVEQKDDSVTFKASEYTKVPATNMPTASLSPNFLSVADVSE
ncbi:uncharacterized protein [Acropora muricata]|uniref:uncharacterized protein n=1 Tax=Acropora muricata TaxID=159855 RepID=UPI0034E47AD7